MTGFEDRERAFESRFQQQQEFEFKVKARRDRLIAEWAASKLALGPEQVPDYITSIMDIPFQAKRDDAIIARLKEDFRVKALAVSEATLRAELTHFQELATQQLKQG